ncbi:hypothetical protein CTAYLR_005720 [Chrysophaeum taylorii]|uniref:RING-type domain-containing protein n=1 Tax=Chrysophaeum taylorii TaxID=2483200 RepID=A0AAD7UIR7_9STRA|nr:hypothetical protein CTAYLR_005720 [Chrysophaeum taylorii]
MMISLIVVALVGIGFTRLTMLALELRDNYDDGANDEPVDLSRKRVDAHNRMVNMVKPSKLVIKGDNHYEPFSTESPTDSNADDSYTAMLASTEAKLQAGLNALFSYGQLEDSVKTTPQENTETPPPAAVTTTSPTTSPIKAVSSQEVLDPEAAQPSAVLDPTDVCTICFEKAKNAVILSCGHGGVCYNCSIDVYVTSGHCPFCRNEIGQIVTVGFGNAAIDAVGNTTVPVIGPK